jgi:high affinity sulfate transporter 1
MTDDRETVAVRELAGRLVHRFVPIVTWLPAMSGADRRAELLPAITSWGVMVPVALAYAGLAGVPPEIGLITAFAGLAGYAVFGTSRHVKATTSSTMAIMSASVVGAMAVGDPERYLALTAGLALVVGVILVAAGIARLGFIADFLTRSVVTGFIFGLAITIIIGQLPKLFGVPGGGSGAIDELQVFLGQLDQTNPYTLAVGGLALALILGLRLVAPRVPGPLLALVLGIVAVTAFDLVARGVSVVGAIDTGVPLPGLPDISLLDIPYLAAGATGIVFLAVGESLGAGRAFAARHRYDIDQDQELVALGAANVSTGLFGGFTVDASLSQTATAEAAGAHTQLSSLITSGLILATALVLAPLFTNLPDAVLGAIVIAAVLGLMDVGELRRYAATRRTDLLLAIVAMIGVVTTTVLTGLVIAVMLSLTLLLYRASRPYVATLGALDDPAMTFADLERHPGARAVPGVLVLRIDAPLYFFNVNVARVAIRDAVRAGDPRPAAVVLAIGATADIDVTSGDTLRQIVTELREEGTDVHFAQVRGSVRDRMRRMGLMDLIGEDHVHLSIAPAVVSATAAAAASVTADGAGPTSDEAAPVGDPPSA